MSAARLRKARAQAHARPRAKRQPLEAVVPGLRLRRKALLRKACTRNQPQLRMFVAEPAFQGFTPFACCANGILRGFRSFCKVYGSHLQVRSMQALTTGVESTASEAPVQTESRLALQKRTGWNSSGASQMSAERPSAYDDMNTTSPAGSMSALTHCSADLLV